MGNNSLLTYNQLKCVVCSNVRTNRPLVASQLISIKPLFAPSQNLVRFNSILILVAPCVMDLQV